eukprot:6068650-Prymnesium_polylepis.1
MSQSLSLWGSRSPLPAAGRRRSRRGRPGSYHPSTALKVHDGSPKLLRVSHTISISARKQNRCT